MDKRRSAASGGTVDGGVLHVHVPPVDPRVTAVNAAIRADPCGTLGHQLAYLTFGGAACTRCGRPC